VEPSLDAVHALPIAVQELQADTIRRSLTPTDAARHRWRESWRSRRRPRFQLLQEWIGRVDSVDETTFRATLTTRAEPDESDFAEIEIEEVSLDERHLLTPGKVFYWVIGYRDEAYGQRFGVSLIHFRKLVGLSDREREIADDRAAHWADLLDAGETAP
jgi:hypothetical protein